MSFRIVFQVYRRINKPCPPHKKRVSNKNRLVNGKENEKKTQILTTENTEGAEKILLTLMDTDFYMIFTVSIIINLCESVSNFSMFSVSSVV